MLSELEERQKNIQDKIKKLTLENDELKYKILFIREKRYTSLCNVFEKKFNCGFIEVRCDCGMDYDDNRFLYLGFYSENKEEFITRSLKVDRFIKYGKDVIRLTEFDKKYEDEQNRQTLLTRVKYLYNLYMNTDYLDNLPLCYTFILSSPFCRDITKIIAHKILFFYFLLFTFYFFLFLFGRFPGRRGGLFCPFGTK